MAAGSRRNTLLCISDALCVELQRLLSSVDDRAVAIDAACDWNRIEVSRGCGSLEKLLRRCFLYFEFAVGDILWRGVGKRDSRRAAERGRLFLRAALDDIHCHRASGHFRLVHRAHWSDGVCDAYITRGAVCSNEDRG